MLKLKRRYKHKFDRIIFHCHWFEKPWKKRGDKVIIGIYKRFFSPTEYEYEFGFLGLRIRVLIDKEFIIRTNKPSNK